MCSSIAGGWSRLPRLNCLPWSGAHHIGAERRYRQWHIGRTPSPRTAGADLRVAAKLGNDLQCPGLDHASGRVTACIQVDPAKGVVLALDRSQLQANSAAAPIDVGTCPAVRFGSARPACRIVGLRQLARAAARREPSLSFPLRVWLRQPTHRCKGAMVASVTGVIARLVHNVSPAHSATGPVDLGWLAPGVPTDLGKVHPVVRPTSDRQTTFVGTSGYNLGRSSCRQSPYPSERVLRRAQSRVPKNAKRRRLVATSGWQSWGVHRAFPTRPLSLIRLDASRR